MRRHRGASADRANRHEWRGQRAMYVTVYESESTFKFVRGKVIEFDTAIAIPQLSDQSQGDA